MPPSSAITPLPGSGHGPRSQPNGWPSSRRALLGLGLGTVVLTAAGCELPGTSNSSDPTPNTSDSATPGLSSDATLVSEARQAIGSMLTLIAQVSARYPRLAESLTELTTLHQAHDGVLGSDSASDPASEGATDGASDGADRTRVPAKSERAIALVRRREVALQALLADSAAQADSGPLARALACASAGIGQHLALWRAA